MQRRTLVALMMMSLALGSGPAAAQTTDELLQGLRKDIDALRQGQLQLQRELQELRGSLRPRAGQPEEQPQNLVLSLDDAPVKGEPAARLVLLDFTDYQ